jgi:hypothetical protein
MLFFNEVYIMMYNVFFNLCSQYWIELHCKNVTTKTTRKLPGSNQQRWSLWKFAMFPGFLVDWP